MILSGKPPFVFMTVIILGLLVGSTLNYMQLSGQKEIHRIAEAQTNIKGTVVYASRDIPEGAEITADALELREELLAKTPLGALTSPSACVGGCAAYPIQQGSLLLSNVVKYVCFAPGIEAKIKDGTRAVTIACDVDGGLAGFINPGSHVDVFCLTNGQAYPVLSNVAVGAVGSTYRGTATGASAVPASSFTMLVNSGDVVKLLSTVAAGRPYLTLRNERDCTATPTVDIASILSKSSKVAN